MPFVFVKKLETDPRLQATLLPPFLSLSLSSHCPLTFADDGVSDRSIEERIMINELLTGA